jgi:hypothetical protein
MGTAHTVWGIPLMETMGTAHTGWGIPFIGTVER